MMGTIRDTLAGLHDDRSCACDPLRPAWRWALRLHRRRRGNVSVFFLLSAVVFYGMAAMVSNTGYLVAGRLQTQNAADAAAYSAAVWTSRCMNMINATNMLILRNLSAHASAVAIIQAYQRIPNNWLDRLAASGNNPAVMSQIMTREFPIYLQLRARHVPAAADGVVNFKYLQEVDRLIAFQQALIEETPGLIESERRKLEAYHRMRIRLTRPGDADGLVRPPLKPGSFITLGHLLGLRVLRTDNRLPARALLSSMPIGGASAEYTGALLTEVVNLASIYGPQITVLVGHNATTEMGPTSTATRAPYSVMATVINDRVSSLGHMAPGIFDQPINPFDACIAYAQAETYNSIHERANAFSIPTPTPYRLWSTWGWRWQPRLAMGDQLRTAMTGDPQVQSIYRQLGVVEPRDEANLRYMALH